MKKLLILSFCLALFFSFATLVFADVWVSGYYRSNGTYVNGHYRSSPDGNPYNNYSYPGNTNPYTGVTAPGNSNTYLSNYYDSYDYNYNSYNSYDYYDSFDYGYDSYDSYDFSGLDSYDNYYSY